jgi:type I restriction enzyme S subunit
MAGQQVYHYSIPVLQGTGDGQLEDGSTIDSAKTLIQERCVLVSKLNPRKGTVCIAAPQAGYLTVGSGELIPLIPREGLVEYVHYVVQSLAYRDRLASLVESATRSHQRASVDDVLKFTWAFPTRAEQRHIVLFLDRETATIDALIAEQERLILLLQEQRQAVISHTVTKGLDPNASTRDSGIEWIGHIPSSWAVLPLKALATIRTGIAKGKEYTDPDLVDVPYLRVANVQDGHLDLDDVATLRIPRRDVDRFALRSGDVLMNEGGDFDKLGRGAVWHGEITPCVTQNHVFAVRPHSISPYWLSEVTSSSCGQFYFMSRAKQSTNLASISSRNLMELPVPVPPAETAAAIVEYLAGAKARITTLISHAEHAISLLRERRTALITAAVTGQIDVRGLVEPAA